MNQQDIVIFGTGNMAQVAAVYIRAHSHLNIVGYTIDHEYRKEDTFDGLPLVSWNDLENLFPPDQVKLLGPLTYQRMNTIRRDRYLEGKSRGYSFASFIHPDCHIYTDKIGDNCLILERNIIQPFSSIGNNVIIWSGNHIGHHAQVGDHVFIASQVGIGGSAVIGNECHLAGQVGVAHGLTLGPRCAVLNGLTLSRSLPEGSVISADLPSIRPFDSSRLYKIL
ncbi:acetyltransferase [Ponticoccus litoralis]|uniref:Acetyltransferase n=1 Tax=Ponticoccus litoralis TaxID=422297 RepID=A0AAW9SAF9_9RHOB